MILSQLRDYLKANGRAALTDLAHRFDTDPGALRPMLERLMTKGQVVRLPEGTACGGGCCKCDAASIEIYAWKSGE